jgi:hypothetical protein
LDSISYRAARLVSGDGKWLASTPGSRKQGDEVIVTIGSSDAKTQRLIIGINHALDFS